MTVVDKNNLLALIKKVSGLTGGVYWIEDPNPTASGEIPTATGPVQAQIKLDLRGLTGVGVDETQYTYTPGSPGSLDTTQTGCRQVTLIVRAEMYRRADEADELLDKIRTRLRRRSSLATLLGLNLAIATIGPTISIPTRYDNRVISCSLMEVVLNGVAIDDISTDTDPAGEGETWIATVDTTNNIPGTIT
jgi:hypothetical protein